MTGPNDTKISLHGLGFIQVEFTRDTRLHVWHPELPRYKGMFDQSVGIHSHSFDFESTVLVGELENLRYGVTHVEPYEYDRSETHTIYMHQGDREPTGQRPWIPRGLVLVKEKHTLTHTYGPGSRYSMSGSELHFSRPKTIEQPVVTLMRKTFDRGNEKDPALSLVRSSMAPEKTFDRRQLSDPVLWGYVVKSLRGVKVGLPF